MRADEVFSSSYLSEAELSSKLARTAANAALAGSLGFAAAASNDTAKHLSQWWNDTHAPNVWTSEKDPHKFGDGDWLTTDTAKPGAVKVSLPEDAKYLALTMWGEARNQGPKGMNAVGHVVVNRLNAKHFGSSVKSVVLHGKQFSCWNPDDPNSAMLGKISKLDPNSEDYKMWQASVTLAKKILAGKSRDPTRGAIYYHTKQVKPSWADPRKMLVSLGQHIFYSGAKKKDDHPSHKATA